jgi:hypothetical protein
MMQSMMGEMMKDGKTMAAMMQMMQQGGMMSKVHAIKHENDGQ